MPLIVETGLIVPDANSYATVAEADARHAMSTSADMWDAFDTPVKEQRLVTATRRLDTMFEWKGDVVSAAQSLGFPRRYGNYTYLRTVPTAVKNATIDLALWLPEEVATSATSGTTEDALQEITLGPIGLKFAASSAATATTTTRPAIPPDVVLMLRALGTYLAGGGGSVGRPRSMNIDALLKTNLARAWVLFKDRTKRCQLRAIQAQPYDVATGTAGSVVTATNIDALLFDPDLSLLGEGTDIQVTDKRAILLTQHLPDVIGRKPIEGRVHVGDRLIDHNGQDWAVILVRGETDFFFDLTIRR